MSVGSTRVIREMRLAPVDVIGFSAGGFIAAEMVAADPQMFKHMILVAPLGLKPVTGEIFDFFAVTIRSHLLATHATRRRLSSAPFMVVK